LVRKSEQKCQFVGGSRLPLLVVSLELKQPLNKYLPWAFDKVKSAARRTGRLFRRWRQPLPFCFKIDYIFRSKVMFTDRRAYVVIGARLLDEN
jgi:hypothetical protein